MEGYAAMCLPLTNETLATDSRDTYFLWPFPQHNIS